MTARRWPMIAVLVLGLGVAVAPAAFKMFDRAPKGGDMIDGFRPYMTDAKIDDFRGDLAVIGAAHLEAEAVLAQLPPTEQARFPAVVTFVAEWPAIDDDMGSMLDTMQRDIGRYRGVASLPPFPLFPFFFVLPGLMLAGFAAWSLRADKGRAPSRGRAIAIVAVAVGLVMAPGIFQMFTRAPGGAEMIADFEPFMTEAKVTQIQGYFLTIGAGEGELRNRLVPGLAAAGVSLADLPAVARLGQEWPSISFGMAPMIGAMADNVGNFNAVRALPPFWLFPWFFVLPGVFVTALVWLAGRPLPSRTPRQVLVPASGGTSS